MKEHEDRNIRSPACFTETPLWVLSRPREDGLLDIAASITEGGRAIACYLSFVHALIDVAYRSSQGAHYLVREACTVDPGVFANAQGPGLIAQLRLAWPANNRKVVLAQDGNSATCARLLFQGRIAGSPLRFEVDDESMGYIDRLYERAGLFAWRETRDEVSRWNLARQKRMLERALVSMEVTQARLEDCREVALFDPEFGQWHFVPYAGL